MNKKLRVFILNLEISQTLPVAPVSPMEPVAPGGPAGPVAPVLPCIPACRYRHQLNIILCKIKYTFIPCYKCIGYQ